MRSAWRMVERRWAITKLVRPFRRMERDFWRRDSVMASMELVASSRMKILGLARRARAKQTSWRWPRERALPDSPTWVLKPSGRVSKRSRQSRARAVSRTSARVAVGREKRMLSRTVPSNRKLVCWTTPRFLRRLGVATWRMSWPSMRSVPLDGR